MPNSEPGCLKRQAQLAPILHRIAAYAICAAGMLALSIPARAAEAKCHLAKIAELPVTMEGLRPMVMAKINDTDVKFVADSGAFFSLLSLANATELKLRLSPAPYGLYLTGAGGSSATVSVAKVNTFTIAGQPLHNVEFLVGGGEIEDDSVGVLGQNFLHFADVEYDLAHGAIRLVHPHDCGNFTLAYWSAGTSLDVSAIDIEATSRASPDIIGVAFINGAKVRVVFDTGSPTSILSTAAALRAGVRTDGPGVNETGWGWGIGKRKYKTYSAPFASFKIGDEEIRNSRMLIGDIAIDDADMLLGADFFLAHRIFVATSQNKMYFTYNGGKVFALSNSPQPPKVDADAATADPMPPAGDGAKPVDAAGFSRRGAVLAARENYDLALASLTRACELDPSNAAYFYQRGMVYWQKSDGVAAMADFDRALQLAPHDFRVLVARAELKLESHDKVAVAADLDVADTVAAKQEDIRYRMGYLYASIGSPSPAIGQFDLWIAAHPDDARMPDALNSRCRARTLQGTDLAPALKDCDAAVRRSTKGSPAAVTSLNSRGLVRLKLGDYPGSMRDYDEALKIVPSEASSLYGRGIDNLRLKKTEAGNADIARAEAISPEVGAEFKRYGVLP
jgi:tetratricopeptide (TPR) repeat protein